MPKRTEGRETQFLTEDEERKLGESLRKALISDRPNPNREGCPDPKTLRDLAFHRRIGDPEVFERATVHVAECSACVRDALGYAEEYKDLRKKIRAAGVLMVITIVLAVSMASWTFWILQHKASKVEIAREVPPDLSPVMAVSKGAGKQQDREPEITQYEPVSIELPSRLRGGVVAKARIVLIRGRLLLDEAVIPDVEGLERAPEPLPDQGRDPGNQRRFEHLREQRSHPLLGELVVELEVAIDLRARHRRVRIELA